MQSSYDENAVSSVDAVEHNLARIAAHDDAIKATITVMAEQALVAAHRLDEAASNGRWMGPLHGMTIGVKDNIDTAGVRTTVGSAFFADHVPDTDATVVQRLKAAGAIIIAKLNLHEFAFGGTTQNVHHGSCRNPWNFDHIPGGSSGGPGAAVAAEMVHAALGTDTGSSIRMPASINGVVGLRPTFGRVPNSGVFPVSPALDTVGPMAHRAEDVARILAAIEGYDANDPASQRGPGDELLRGLHAGIKGVTIGVPSNFFFEDCDPPIARLVREAIEVFAALGAKVVDIHVPSVQEAAERIFPVICSDAAAIHAERMATEPEKFGSQELDRLTLGLKVTGVEYAQSMEWMRRWKRQLAALFEKVDIIVSPTVPIVTPPVAGIDMIGITSRLTEKVYAYPMAGNPAVSVPVGFTDGLPVGMQLAGAWWRDGMLLRAAVAYQSVTDWHMNRPALLG